VRGGWWEGVARDDACWILRYAPGSNDRHRLAFTVGWPNALNMHPED
jgi:hypothetical protein